MSLKARIRSKIVARPGRVWKRSLSLRGIEAFLAITLFSLGEAVLPSLAVYIPIPPVYLLAAASFCGTLAYGARFLFQKGINDEK